MDGDQSFRHISLCFSHTADVQSHLKRIFPVRRFLFVFSFWYVFFQTKIYFLVSCLDLKPFSIYMNHISHVLKNNFFLMWQPSDERYRKWYGLNLVFFLKVGFNAFLRREISPLFRASWNLYLVVLVASGSVWILDLLKGGVCLKMS